MSNIIHRFMLLVLCMVATGVVDARAQRCKASKQATTPTTDFVINDNGTVLHKKTGLMWKRCIEGTRGSGCSSGKPKKLFWEDMAKEYKRSSFAGKRDWRIPSVEEMKSIIEKKCKGPALNLEIFPDGSALPNWTSSEIAGGGGKAWQMYMTSGVAIKANKAVGSALRLVRTP